MSAEPSTATVAPGRSRPRRHVSWPEALLNSAATLAFGLTAAGVGLALAAAL